MLINKKIFSIFCVCFALYSNDNTLNIQNMTSDTGINIQFIAKPDTNIAAIQASFLKRGNFFETVPGVSTLLAKTIRNSSTKTYPGAQIAKTFLKSSFYCDITNEDFSFDINLKYINDNQDETNIAQDILKEMLTCSTLDSFELDKQTTINIYKNNLQSPKTKMLASFFPLMFPNHSCGKITTNDDCEKISSDIVKTAYNELFSRDNLKVVVVGNFPSKDVVKLVDHIYGNLPKTVKGKYFTTNISKIQPNKFNLEQQDSDLSDNIIYFVLNKIPTFKSNAAIYLKIANEFFGGSSLDNRLLQHLRKNNGLVYAANSFIEHKYLTNYLLGLTESSDALSTKNAIIETFQNFANKGISQKELDSAKITLLSNYVLNVLDNSENIADCAMNLWKHGCCDINHYYQKIQNAKLKEVNTAIKKYFNPHNLSFGIVYNCAKIDDNKPSNNTDKASVPDCSSK